MRLWALQQIDPTSAEYNVPVALQLDGELELGALDRALRGLVARHEVLRTTFAVKDGEPVQSISAEPEVALEVIDLSAAGKEEARRRARERCEEEALRPFDLARGPLLRAFALRIEPEEHVFLLVFHHIVTDGWSDEIIGRELGELYAAALGDREADLAPLPIQYADFAVWERGQLQEDSLEQELDFWRQRLQGVPALELPTDKPRPAVRSGRGTVHHFELPAALVERLRALAREADTTLFITLLASYAVLLRRLSGQRDFAIGTPIAGRPRPELESLVGFFINTLALRCDLSDESSFAELLRRVREETLEAFRHQETPFQHLVEHLSLERDRSRTPIFQTLFQLDQPGEEWRLAGAAIEELQLEGGGVKGDLALGLTERPDGSLAAALEYTVDLFEPATAERIATHFELLLESILDDPERSIGELEGAEDFERFREEGHLEFHDRDNRVDVPSEGEGDGSPQPYVAARNAEEGMLAAIWAEILGHHRVGINDRFFDLGGDSIRAVKVAHAAQRQGLDVQPREVVEHQTVAELVAACMAAGHGRSAPPIPPAPRDEPLPLSSGQMRLWALQQIDPTSAEYNVPVALRLDGELEPGALERALRGLAARHEVLRTTFAVKGGGPVQTISAEADLALETIDLSAAGEAEARRLALERCEAEALRPFDLARGPLLRAFAFRVAPAEHVFLLVFHHIATDGWSDEIIGRELGELYAAALDGREADLAPLPVQYADFAVWERGRLEEDSSEAQLAFWRQRLQGVPALELPTDKPRPAVRSGLGTAHHFELPAALGERLRALAREADTTLFVTLFSAFAVLLRRLSGQRDFAIGTPVAGRPRPELESLVGFFINTLALRCDLGEEPGFAELLRRVREETLEAFRHQETPFQHLVEHLSPERDRSRTPIFQALFQLDQPGEEWRLPGLAIEELPLEGGGVKGDLALGLTERPDGSLAGALEYATDLFEPATAERIATHFEALLDLILDDPERSIEELEGAEDFERFREEGHLGFDDRSTDRGDALADGQEDKSERPYVAARNAEEGLLAAIWAEVLGHDRVGINDRFFDLGGDSIRAVEAANAAQRQGLDVQPGDVFEHQTVAELVAAVLDRSALEGRGAEGEIRRTIVGLKPEGSLRPLFCVHPSGGSVAWYQPLATALPPERPLHAFQPLGLANELHEQATMEEIASVYLGEMRKVQPDGPYALLGWSMGGAIALEMARQLQARGESVAPLLLPEPSLPGNEADLRRGERELAICEEAATLIDRVLEVPDGDPERDAREQRLLRFLDEVEWPRSEARLGTALPARAEAMLLRAYINHAPGPYDGRVDLVVSEECVTASDERPSVVSHGSFDAYLAQWQEMTGDQIELHRLGRDHITMLQEPFATELAALFERLAAAEGNAELTTTGLPGPRTASAPAYPAGASMSSSHQS